MLESITLSNVGPAREMQLDFARRLNLITGDNGLGKSFLLDITWWALTRRWPHQVNNKLTSGFMAKPIDIRKPATIEFRLRSKTKSVSYESRYAPKDESWLGKPGRPWNPGLVIYAQCDGSFSVWDPARNYWKTKGNADIQTRLPCYVFSPTEVWDGLDVEFEGREVRACNGLISDWAGWIKEDGLQAQRMREVLKNLSASNDARDQLSPGPLRRISIEDARDVPSIKTSYLDSVPVLYASSGVKRIIALAYMLLWTWYEHHNACGETGEDPTNQVVFLIDEIECHLHPRWQRTILKSIMHLVSLLHHQAETQLITATHSPMVMASAEPVFEFERDAWFDLDLVDDGQGAQVLLQKRPFVRHGDVANWLTSEAFDLGQPRSREAEETIQKALNLLRNQADATPSQYRSVDKELRRLLGEMDPFWIDWSYHLEKLGIKS